METPGSNSESLSGATASTLASLTAVCNKDSYIRISGSSLAVTSLNGGNNYNISIPGSATSLALNPQLNNIVYFVTGNSSNASIYQCDISTGKVDPVLKGFAGYSDFTCDTNGQIYVVVNDASGPSVKTIDATGALTNSDFALQLSSFDTGDVDQSGNVFNVKHYTTQSVRFGSDGSVYVLAADAAGKQRLFIQNSNAAPSNGDGNGEPFLPITTAEQAVKNYIPVNGGDCLIQMNDGSWKQYRSASGNISTVDGLLQKIDYNNPFWFGPAGVGTSNTLDKGSNIAVDSSLNVHFMNGWDSVSYNIAALLPLPPGSQSSQKSDVVTKSVSSTLAIVATQSGDFTTISLLNPLTGATTDQYTFLNPNQPETSPYTVTIEQPDGSILVYVAQLCSSSTSLQTDSTQSGDYVNFSVLNCDPATGRIMVATSVKQDLSSLSPRAQANGNTSAPYFSGGENTSNQITLNELGGYSYLVGLPDGSLLQSSETSQPIVFPSYTSVTMATSNLADVPEFLGGDWAWGNETADIGVGGISFVYPAKTKLNNDTFTKNFAKGTNKFRNLQGFELAIKGGTSKLKITYPTEDAPNPEIKKNQIDVFIQGQVTKKFKFGPEKITSPYQPSRDILNKYNSLVSGGDVDIEDTSAFWNEIAKIKGDQKEFGVTLGGGYTWTVDIGGDPASGKGQAFLEFAWKLPIRNLGTIAGLYLSIKLKFSTSWIDNWKSLPSTQGLGDISNLFFIASKDGKTGSALQNVPASDLVYGFTASPITNIYSPDNIQLMAQVSALIGTAYQVMSYIPPQLFITLATNLTNGDGSKAVQNAAPGSSSTPSIYGVIGKNSSLFQFLGSNASAASEQLRQLASFSSMKNNLSSQFIGADARPQLDLAVTPALLAEISLGSLVYIKASLGISMSVTHDTASGKGAFKTSGVFDGEVDLGFFVRIPVNFTLKFGEVDWGALAGAYGLSQNEANILAAINFAPNSRIIVSTQNAQLPLSLPSALESGINLETGVTSLQCVATYDVKEGQDRSYNIWGVFLRSQSLGESNSGLITSSYFIRGIKDSATGVINWDAATSIDLGSVGLFDTVKISADVNAGGEVSPVVAINAALISQKTQTGIINATKSGSGSLGLFYVSTSGFVISKETLESATLTAKAFSGGLSATNSGQFGFSNVLFDAGTQKASDYYGLSGSPGLNFSQGAVEFYHLSDLTNAGSGADLSSILHLMFLPDPAVVAASATPTNFGYSLSYSRDLSASTKGYSDYAWILQQATGAGAAPVCYGMNLGYYINQLKYSPQMKYYVGSTDNPIYSILSPQISQEYQALSVTGLSNYYATDIGALISYSLINQAANSSKNNPNSFIQIALGKPGSAQKTLEISSAALQRALGIGSAEFSGSNATVINPEIGSGFLMGAVLGASGRALYVGGFSQSSQDYLNSLGGDGSLPGLSSATGDTIYSPILDISAIVGETPFAQYEISFSSGQSLIIAVPAALSTKSDPILLSDVLDATLVDKIIINSPRVEDVLGQLQSLSISLKDGSAMVSGLEDMVAGPVTKVRAVNSLSLSGFSFAFATNFSPLSVNSTLAFDGKTTWYSIATDSSSNSSLSYLITNTSVFTNLVRSGGTYWLDVKPFDAPASDYKFTNGVDGLAFVCGSKVSTYTDKSGTQFVVISAPNSSPNGMVDAGAIYMLKYDKNLINFAKASSSGFVDPIAYLAQFPKEGFSAAGTAANQLLGTSTVTTNASSGDNFIVTGSPAEINLDAISSVSSLENSTVLVIDKANNKVASSTAITDAGTVADVRSLIETNSGGLLVWTTPKNNADGYADQNLYVRFVGGAYGKFGAYVIPKNFVGTIQSVSYDEKSFLLTVIGTDVTTGRTYTLYSKLTGQGSKSGSWSELSQIVPNAVSSQTDAGSLVLSGIKSKNSGSSASDTSLAGPATIVRGSTAHYTLSVTNPAIAAVFASVRAWDSSALEGKDYNRLDIEMQPLIGGSISFDITTNSGADLVRSANLNLEYTLFDSSQKQIARYAAPISLKSNDAINLASIGTGASIKGPANSNLAEAGVALSQSSVAVPNGGSFLTLSQNSVDGAVSLYVLNYANQNYDLSKSKAIPVTLNFTPPNGVSSENWLFSQNSSPVQTLYDSLFGRTADAAGLQYWNQLYASGVSLNVISDAFIRSPEFVNDYGKIDPQSVVTPTIVKEMYWTIFGRAPDADGLNYWSNSGLTTAQLLATFVQSSEFTGDFSTINPGASITAIGSDYIALAQQTTGGPGAIVFTKKSNFTSAQISSLSSANSFLVYDKGKSATFGQSIIDSGGWLYIADSANGVVYALQDSILNGYKSGESVAIQDLIAKYSSLKQAYQIKAGDTIGFGAALSIGTVDNAQVLAIGAPNANPSDPKANYQVNGGRVYLLKLSDAQAMLSTGATAFTVDQSGFTNGLSVCIINAPTTLDSDPSSTSYNVAYGAQLGTSVTFAHIINDSGSGASDLILGAPTLRYLDSSLTPGGVYVLDGKNAYFKGTGSPNIITLPADNKSTGSLKGGILYGTLNKSMAGSSVVNAGPFTGSKTKDVLAITAPNDLNGSGIVYMYVGNNKNFSGYMDLNAFSSDNSVFQYIGVNNGSFANGIPSQNGLGTTAISLQSFSRPLGDFPQSDLLLSAPGAAGQDSQAFLIYGKPYLQAGMSIPQSILSGGIGEPIVGNGLPVALGDMNKDGFTDYMLYPVNNGNYGVSKQVMVNYGLSPSATGEISPTSLNEGIAYATSSNKIFTNTPNANPFDSRPAVQIPVYGAQNLLFQNGQKSVVSVSPSALFTTVTQDPEVIMDAGDIIATPSVISGKFDRNSSVAYAFQFSGSQQYITSSIISSIENYVYTNKDITADSFVGTRNTRFWSVAPGFVQGGRQDLLIVGSYEAANGSTLTNLYVQSYSYNGADYSWKNNTDGRSLFGYIDSVVYLNSNIMKGYVVGTSTNFSQHGSRDILIYEMKGVADNYGSVNATFNLWLAHEDDARRITRDEKPISAFALNFNYKTDTKITQWLSSLTSETLGSFIGDFNNDGYEDAFAVTGFNVSAANTGQNPFEYSIIYGGSKQNNDYAKQKIVALPGSGPLMASGLGSTTGAGNSDLLLSPLSSPVDPNAQQFSFLVYGQNNSVIPNEQRINGGEGADDIKIDKSFVIQSGVTRIVIDLAQGNDLLTITNDKPFIGFIENTSNSAYISGGSGDDVFSLASEALYYNHSLIPDITFDGGSGFNSIVFNDVMADSTSSDVRLYINDTKFKNIQKFDLQGQAATIDLTRVGDSEAGQTRYITGLLGTKVTINLPKSYRTANPTSLGNQSYNGYVVSGETFYFSTNLIPTLNLALVDAPVLNHLSNTDSALFDVGFVVTTGSQVSITKDGNVLTLTDVTNYFAITTVDGNEIYTAKTGAFAGSEIISVSATLVDQSGNTSVPSVLNLKPIDTVAPTVPAIGMVTYDNNLRQWVLSGHGSTNSTVTVYDGQQALGTTQVDANGSWTLNSGVDNSVIREFSAVAKDAAGNQSTPSPNDWRGSPGADFFNIVTMSLGDQATGGAGADTYDLTTTTNSLAARYLTVNDFGESGRDTFKIGHSLTAFNNVSSSSATGLSGDLAGDLGKLLNVSNFQANGAALVTIALGADAGSYAVVNDGTAGFNPLTDAVVKLQPNATLTAANFVV